MGITPLFVKTNALEKGGNVTTTKKGVKKEG
jgi:hypothetical protein